MVLAFFNTKEVVVAALVGVKCVLTHYLLVRR